MTSPSTPINFRFLGNVQVDEFRAEINLRSKLFERDSRKNFDRHSQTQSIALRGKRPGLDPHRTRISYGNRFPKIMAWLNEFASIHGELGLALVVRLQPEGLVKPHIDHGDYYTIRDRYHLVIDSTGSVMRCGDEESIWHSGQLWWFDNKSIHSAYNPGPDWRTHVIFDLKREN